MEGRWWERLLHTHRETQLQKTLLRDGGPDIAVVAVPWQIEPPDAAEVLAAEEPATA